MPVIDVRHTADLGPAETAAVRELLWAAFTGEDAMTEEDFEHCLGGLHVIVWDGEAAVAHGAVVMRRLLHGGRALRTGYVEGVAVRADRRRAGLGHAVMAELERIIEGAYELGALGTSDDGVPLYLSRGWQPWPGPTGEVTVSGTRRTPDEDGWIYVWPPRAVPPGPDAGQLTCDPRAGSAW